MPTLFEVLHRKAEPYKVKLIKGQKGGYGWEITVSAESLDNTIYLIKDANVRMFEIFGGGDAHE